MNVLKKINRMRLERRWSIYRLSIESGIPQSTLTNMFNRETLPSIATLEMLCGAFGVTMSEFFSEDNEEENLAGFADFETEFRKLSARDKYMILDIMRRLNEEN